VSWYALLNAIALATLLTFSHGLMKWVANKNIEVDYLSTVINNWFYIGLAISVYGFLFLYYIQILKKVNIGIFYASYTGLSLVLVLLVGVLFFQEHISQRQILGIVCIIVGIFLLKAA